MSGLSGTTVYAHTVVMAELTILGLALVGIALFVLWIILGIWVYRDAKQRFPENSLEPVLWLLIVLLTGIVGLIIYLVVRPKE